MIQTAKRLICRKKSKLNKKKEATILVLASFFAYSGTETNYIILLTINYKKEKTYYAETCSYVET